MKVTAIKISKILGTVAASTLLWGCLEAAKTETNNQAIDPSEPVSDWELVWSDEFDGTSIDTSKWNHEVNCNGGGNNEQQCYTDSAENSYVQDGILHVVALPAAEGADKPYTSARLNSKGKGDFKYGRFEIRAKLPSGQGSWPAFWMLPTDNRYGGWPKSGEIDIVEAVNLKVADGEGKLENKVYGTLHYGNDWPDNVHSGKEYELPDGLNPADDFHTYAIEWQEGEIRWYVDNYLYATQRQSSLRYNSKQEPVGLAHKGWFVEYFNAGTGELEKHWDEAPFDQDFHMLINFAVGGDWPENVNATGVDAAAFANGQHYEVDYVRVYQCSLDTATGKGCETLRQGYDSFDDALVEGKAPTPPAPVQGPSSYVIFEDDANPSWPAWDCCAGSSPEVVADDAEHGNVTEFVIGANPTVMGFISRDAFITEEDVEPIPFDGSGIVENGLVQFDFKLTNLPNDASAPWLFKIESNGGPDAGGSAVEISLSDNVEGFSPVLGEWQTYTFTLADLAAEGLELSGIDVIMVFPAWGQGEGAEFRMDNVKIYDPTASNFAGHVLFDDQVLENWELWDCCAGSTPTIETDDNIHGNVAEFAIGAASETVLGLLADEGAEIDASNLLENGVVEFEMKLVTAPNNATTPWRFKIESTGAATAVELGLEDSLEGTGPVEGQWQKYTFPVQQLFDEGLDISSINVLMIFPAWGTGEGAVFRVDNVRIYDPSSLPGLTVFADGENPDWPMWDCCAGSTPAEVDDGSSKGIVAEFAIGAASETVLGFLAEDGAEFDASEFLENGVIRFDMKLVTAPNDSTTPWRFKVESLGASTALELGLEESEEGMSPVVGQWQTYTYSLNDLFNGGVDISAIDVLMVFPAWGTGEGAVFRIDNVRIGER